MKINNIMALAMSTAAASILALCGSTEIGNARVEITGSIADNGNAVDSAEVELIAEEYIPGGAKDDKVFAARTDCRD